MKAKLEKSTGMKREELEKFYIEKVNKAMSFGFSEEEAREIVQESLKKSLGLK